MTNAFSRFEQTPRLATSHVVRSLVLGFVRVALVAVLLIVHGSGPPF